jgi:glycosyltransferase involved in cell wall biosynthesis
LKVIFLTHEYPPYIFGGIGGFVKNLATGLLKKGVKASVICGYPTMKATARRYSQTISEGVTIFRCPYPNLPPHHVVFQLANLKNFTKIVEAEAPDIIHGQSGSSYPALIPLQASLPFLTSFHSSPRMDRIWSTHSILRGGTFKDLWTYVIGHPSEEYVYRNEFQRSDLSIAVSNTLKSELLIEMGVEYAEQTRYIYNGVDLARLDEEYRQATAEVDEDPHTILFAGRLYWRKGALNVLQLAYLLHKNKTPFNVIVHGTGPLFKKGFTPLAELVKSMARSKYLALPSFYDSCPMALLDSMCLGKIPLLLDLPFASELTDGGTYGILAPNMSQLTKKLIALSEERDIETFSRHIRTFARKQYNVDETARRYLEAYQELDS